MPRLCKKPGRGSGQANLVVFATGLDFPLENVYAAQGPVKNYGVLL